MVFQNGGQIWDIDIITKEGKIWTIAIDYMDSEELIISKPKQIFNEYKILEIARDWHGTYYLTDKGSLITMVDNEICTREQIEEDRIGYILWFLQDMGPLYMCNNGKMSYPGNEEYKYIIDKKGEDLVAKNVFRASADDENVYIITMDNKLMCLNTALEIVSDDTNTGNLFILYESTKNKIVGDYSINKYKDYENLGKLEIIFTDGSKKTIKDIVTTYWSMADKKMIEIK